jgi:hypothetical protein
MKVIVDLNSWNVASCSDKIYAQRPPNLTENEALDLFSHSLQTNTVTVAKYAPSSSLHALSN